MVESIVTQKILSAGYVSCERTLPNYTKLVYHEHSYVCTPVNFATCRQLLQAVPHDTSSVTKTFAPNIFA